MLMVTLLSVCLQKIIDPGNFFLCDFGVDPALKLVCFPRSEQVIEHVSNSLIRVEQTFMVKNPRSYCMDSLHITARLPLLLDRRVSISLVQPDCLREDCVQEETPINVIAAWIDPETSHRRGEFEWICRLEPSSELTLKMEYEMRAQLSIQSIRQAIVAR